MRKATRKKYYGEPKDRKATRKKYYGEPKDRVKHDAVGPLYLLAYADSYVMYRRPGASPLVMAVREWDALRDAPLNPSAAPLTESGATPTKALS